MKNVNSSWQIDLYSGLNNAITMQDILDATLKITKRWGFDYCGWRSKLPMPLSQHKFSVLNSNEDRVTEKRATGYYDNAPVVKHCATSIEPFVWQGTTDDYAFLKAPSLFEEYYSLGHYAGWAQSIIEGKNMFSMFYVDSTNKLTAKDFEAVDSKLQWIAVAVLCHMNKIKLQPNISLSAREKEILRWTGDGKTASEIGQILSLSHSTINFHLHNAMFKLDSPNKTSAVVKAIYLNLLY